MGHLLTIRGDEAYALAEELAALRGETVETAVTSLLRDGIERERRRAKEIEELTAAAAAFRASLQEPPASSDHGWLYDPETGLPR